MNCRITNFFKEHHTFLIGAIGILIFYLIFQLTVFQTNTEYDHNRDLVITRELAEQGTFSYFGQVYVINPPLNYILHALPIWITGHFSYVLQKVLEIILFWVGICLTYFVALEFFSDKKKALSAFILAAVTWSFILASAIRFYSVVLLFGNVLLLSYLLYIKHPSTRRLLFFGVAIGLAMLIKSSFVFFILILLAHFFAMHIIQKDIRRLLMHSISLAIAPVLIYLPYLIYICANKLPMPWQAYSLSTGQQAAWLAGYVHPPVWSGYVQLFKFWPVLTSIAVVATILFFCKERGRLNKKLFLVISLFLLTPLMTWFIRAADMHHWFYVFTALPLLAVYAIYKLAETTKVSSRILFCVLLLAILSMWAIKLPHWGHNIQEYWASEVFTFMSGLKANESILSEWNYNLFDALSPAYVGYSAQFNPAQAAIYGANYYVAIAKQDLEFLQFNKLITTPPPKQELHIYEINLPKVYTYLNLTSRGKLKLINSKNKPVKSAQCYINSISAKWAIQQISDNAGEMEYIVPLEWSGPANISCMAIGYKPYDAAIVATNINLGKLSAFFHKYTVSRY